MEAEKRENELLATLPQGMGTALEIFMLRSTRMMSAGPPQRSQPEDREGGGGDECARQKEDG